MHKVASLLMQSTYEIWKARCDKVHKEECSNDKKYLLDRVTEVLENETSRLVEAFDRKLFRKKNVPTMKNNVGEIDRWIKCVNMSVIRKRDKDKLLHSSLVDFIRSKSRPG